MSKNQTLQQTEAARFRELITELGLPLKKLPEILSMGVSDCLAWWSEDLRVKINESHFNRLTGMLAINEDQLFLGTYDRELARKRIFGDYTSLPARYEENKNSFVRTSAHIMRYITLTRGQIFADQVVNSLNVSPLIYQDLNTQINLTYFADLLETLAKMGFSQDELDTLASVNFLTLQESQLGKQFQQAENYFDIYKTLANSFHYFDSNFEYKSEFVGKKYILKTVLPLDEHEYLKHDMQTMARLVRYRHILLAWFPHLGSMAPLFPKADVSYGKGTLEMRYEIDLGAEVKPPMTLHVV
jgi:hypothetical protein